MKLRKYIPPLSILLFLALTLAGTYYVRRSLFEQALRRAMEADDEDNVRRMIDSWPSPVGGRYWDTGETPLWWAAQKKKWDIVRLRLEKGGDPNLHGPMTFGLTPLGEAASAGNQQMVDLLIRKGADVNGTGWAGGNVIDTGDVIVEPGSGALSTVDNQTPLRAAAFLENGMGVLNSLLTHGADPNIPDDRGCVPLHYAAYQNGDHAPEVRLLLEHGADPNVLDKQGCTPLHVAAAVKCNNVLRVLLEKGGKIDTRNRFGRTPLHEAARSCNKEGICILLEHGAEVNAKDRDGKTPLALLLSADIGSLYVSNEHRGEAVEVLHKAGAKE